MGKYVFYISAVIGLIVFFVSLAYRTSQNLKFIVFDVSNGTFSLLCMIVGVFIGYGLTSMFTGNNNDDDF